MKNFKNKRGFTLVELLAVIVILALIMGIAVISMSGVLDDAKRSTMKRTAGAIINGVRQQLISANMLEEGYYSFESKILDKGGTDAPLGGEYAYISGKPDGSTVIGTLGIYKEADDLTCEDTAKSFVRVTKDADSGNYVFSICLTAGDGNHYINNGNEEALLDNNDVSMIIKG